MGRGMRNIRDNFWLDAPYETGSVLWGKHEADVAVVGGGFTGLAAAYFIKQRFPGMKVVVLEKEFIGFGASGRNTGISGATLGHSLFRLKKKFGAEKIVPLQKLAHRSFSLVEELINKHDIECDYERPGLLILARSGKEVGILEREAKACEEIGIEATMLDGRQASGQFGALRALAALKHSEQGMLNPAKFVRGMKSVVESLGVEVYENSGCTRIEPGPEISLYTSGGQVKARDIVMATNAYTNPLSLFEGRVLPLYVYNIVTEPLTQSQLEKFQWPGRAIVFNTQHLFWVVRLTADNRLVFIYNNALYFYDRDKDYSHCPGEYRRHYELLIRLFPFLKGIDVTHQWGGRIGMTLDFLPSVGCMGKHRNIFYGLGYNGHGVAFSQLAGKMIAALMAGEKSGLTDHALINRRSLPLPSSLIAYIGINGYKFLYKIDDWILDLGN